MPTIQTDTVVTSVITAVAAVLHRDTAMIEEQTRLFTDLGLDSTNVLELLMNLEDELGIEFEADNLEQHHFETVGTLASYVREQIAG